MLFYKVQDVLDGRSCKYLPKALSEAFPLRGFFICPDCGKMLTESISKRLHKYYPYYHCSAGCRYRINSETANGLFIQNLKKPIPNIYANVIGDCYRE
jgi:site-specific DNA recombinase